MDAIIELVQAFRAKLDYAYIEGLFSNDIFFVVFQKVAAEIIPFDRSLSSYLEMSMGAFSASSPYVSKTFLSSSGMV